MTRIAEPVRGVAAVAATDQPAGDVELDALVDPEPMREAAGERIGILGGTFDPPHIGHLWLASLAREAASLDRVLFMPASQPPHKRLRGMTKAADRLLMTRLAIEGDDHLELTAVEMERPGPSYTVDSIDALQAMYGTDARLFLIMAADSLAQVESWREPHRLLERTEWLVGPRPGSALPRLEDLRDRFGAQASRIHLLQGPALEISSSVLRGRVAAGQTIRYLVPRRVEELIAARGLYRRR